jgi:hypothetical protein
MSGIKTYCKNKTNKTNNIVDQIGMIFGSFSTVFKLLPFKFLFFGHNEGNHENNSKKIYLRENIIFCVANMCYSFICLRCHLLIYFQ